MSADLKITPKGEITWKTHDLTTGRLYMPQGHDDAIDPMQLFDAVDDDRNRHRRLGVGTEGVVYDIGGYAVKAHIDPSVSDGIATLRANVTLAEGLKRIAQPQNSSFEIVGAEVRAAFIPDPLYEDKLGYHAIWLMDIIHSPIAVSRYLKKRENIIGKKINKKHPLPTIRQRRETYDAALQYYGLSFNDIVNDEADFKDINLMISELPTERQRGKLVKFDERPKYGKDSFSSY